MTQAKNLTAATETKTVAGESQSADMKGKIMAYMWHLQKQGRTTDTCRNYGSKLYTMLNDNINLLDPEAVKEYIAKKQGWQPNTKFLAVTTYDGFIKYLGLTWQKPQYKTVQTIPFIPTEMEIDSLIACTGKMMSPLLQLLKETGMRIGEALRLKWINVDTERNILTLNDPEKNSNPRIWKVSNVLMQKLGTLQKKDDYIFANRLRQSVRQNFALQRKRIASKLGNPRLLRITFHTFRHWKATMEYHKTKDILHTMQFLGHRNIKNTLIYTQLVKFQESDQYYGSTAKTTEEAKKLVESGFEYVCTTPESLMLFRKRK